MDEFKKINSTLMNLFNVVLKLEEEALKESSFGGNLSITEMHTLEAIGLDKERTMTEVAGILKINVSTLTSAINKLVNKGYVERFRIPRDRRIVNIRLTEEGKNAVTAHEKFYGQMVKGAMEDLPESRVKGLIMSLEDINHFMGMQLVKPIKNRKDYKLAPLRIGNHQLPIPIFQGGMGIGISKHKLASTVAKEGGLGVIAAADIGYMEEDYETNPIEANKRALRREISKAKDLVKPLTQRGLIGINLPYSTKNYQEYIMEAVSAGVEVIISGAGLPMNLPSMVKDKNVALIPVISSARAAKVIMKNWQRKHGRLPDAFVFESAFAGGQLGYKESKIISGKENFYKTILEIKCIIGEIPLIVAGGIYHREDGENAFIYGADGLQIGSRFVTTVESDAHENFKKAYLNCTENDVTIIKSPSGMPCRALRNSFTKKHSRDENYHLEEALIKAAKGDVDQGLVFCGSNSYLASKEERVSDIFEEFTS